MATNETDPDFLSFMESLGLKPATDCVLPSLSCDLSVSFAPPSYSSDVIKVPNAVSRSNPAVGIGLPCVVDSGVPGSDPEVGEVIPIGLSGSDGGCWETVFRKGRKEGRKGEVFADGEEYRKGMK